MEASTNSICNATCLGSGSGSQLTTPRDFHQNEPCSKSQLKEMTFKISIVVFETFEKNYLEQPKERTVLLSLLFITLISMKPQLGSYYTASHESPAWQGYCPAPSTPHAQQVVLTILCWSLHSFKTTMLPEVAKT